MNNIVLTAVGCPGGPTIIEALREDKSLRIIGTDMRSDVPAKYMVDDFIQIPPGRNLDFIPFMLDLVKKKKASVILPLATFELDNLAEQKKIFEKVGCNVCVSEFEQISIANNKYKLYGTLGDSNYVPKYFSPRSLDEFILCAERLGYPQKKFVVKLHVSHGSIGLRVVSSDIAKLDMFLNEKPNNINIDYSSMVEILKNAIPFPDILVTEYLPFDEYGIDLLIDPQTNKVIMKMVRDNGNVSLSSVDGGKIIQTDLFDDLVDDIMDRLRLSYAINIDVKLDEHKQPKLLEINPRLPATSHLAVKSGWNLPLLSIYLAQGRKVNIPPLRLYNRIYSYRGFLVVDKHDKVLA